MRRMMMVAIGSIPIVAFSLLPKPAAAETVLQRPFLSPTVLAERPYVNDRRDNNDRRDDWRNRNSDQFNNRRDNKGRYDDRQRYDSNGRDGNRRDNQRRVWIPGHWERGFLGIGRHWVAGHYDYATR